MVITMDYSATIRIHICTCLGWRELHKRVWGWEGCGC